MSVRLDHGDDEAAEVHDINVTPFIDVMLVLLIIFMVAAPLATVSVPVNLPSSSAPPKPPVDKPVFLTLKSDLDLYLGDSRIERGSLSAELDRATKRDKAAPVFVRADKTVAYGDLMAVMDSLRLAGYLKVVLVGLESLGPT